MDVERYSYKLTDHRCEPTPLGLALAKDAAVTSALAGIFEHFEATLIQMRLAVDKEQLAHCLADPHSRIDMVVRINSNLSDIRKVAEVSLESKVEIKPVVKKETSEVPMRKERKSFHPTSMTIDKANMFRENVKKTIKKKAEDKKRFSHVQTKEVTGSDYGSW